MIRKRSSMNMEDLDVLASSTLSYSLQFGFIFLCQYNEIQRNATEQPTEITVKLESEMQKDDILADVVAIQITFTGAAVMNQMPELSD
ncbi:hypothetical protein T09_4890 [Trichinella sp. T9]|nr:hypothetical protein T09_4890 [Trichinella sp. T9]